MPGEIPVDEERGAPTDDETDGTNDILLQDDLPHTEENKIDENHTEKPVQEQRTI